MNNMAKQRILPLHLREAKGRNSFVVGESNFEAIKWIDKFPNWKNDGLIIIGPKSSGKSHLTSVWQNKSLCTVLRSKDIENENVALLHTKHLAIENIELISNYKFLFHIINIKKEKNFKILFTSRENINDLNISLKDTISRLLTFPQAKILLPTDDVLRGLIYKLLTDKGIQTNSSLINYISLRIERTYEAVNDFIFQIDHISLERKKNITIPMIKEVIEKKYTINFKHNNK